MDTYLKTFRKYKIGFYIFNGIVLLIAITCLILAILFTFTIRLLNLNDNADNITKSTITEKNEIKFKNFLLHYTNNVGIPMLTMSIIKICISIGGFVSVFFLRPKHSSDPFWGFILNTFLFMIAETIMLLGILYDSSSIYSHMKLELLTYFNEYSNTSYGSDRGLTFMDIIQIRMNCCGVISYEDYEKNVSKKFPINCPISCCDIHGNHDRSCHLDSYYEYNRINPNGCFQSIRTIFIFIYQLILTIWSFDVILSLILIIISTKLISIHSRYHVGEKQQPMWTED